MSTPKMPETGLETPPDRKPARAARMNPEARREQLVEQAAEFFSENGFDAGTRQLASQLGVTQPLIYRYFKSKEDLINEVYRMVYVGQWQDEWTSRLRDRSLPMQDRLIAFYRSYCPAIFNRRWMRIFFFAALKGLDINARYVARVAKRILHPIADEMRAELGIDSAAPITRTEEELVWLMHGAVFYQGIREHVYRTVDDMDYDFGLRMAVDLYLVKARDLVARAVANAEDGKPDPSLVHPPCQATRKPPSRPWQ